MHAGFLRVDLCPRFGTLCYGPGADRQKETQSEPKCPDCKMRDAFKRLGYTKNRPYDRPTSLRSATSSP